MKKLIFTLAFLLAIPPALFAGSETQLEALSYNSTGVTYANLALTPEQTNGTSVYCSDCVAGTSVCIAGGTGSQAYRANGVWSCLSAPTSVTVPIPTDFGFNFTGVPVTGTIGRWVMDRTITIPANYTASGNAAASQGSARVAATAQAIYSIFKNDTTAEGTCTYAISAKVCTFASNAGYTLAAGDSLSIVAPTADATLADVSITIGATK